MSVEEKETKSQTDVPSDEEDKCDEIHFEPVVTLPEVKISTNEENEEELVKLRAKLFRFVSHEWKERGTGEIKLLRHCENNSVRVVMRREKTLKICANHFITPEIQLNSHCNSEKDFNWTSFADFADEQPNSELFAIRFGTVENAKIWKKKFEEAKVIVKTKCTLYNGQEQTEQDNETSSEESDDEVSDDRSKDIKENSDDNKHDDTNKNDITENKSDNVAIKMTKAVEELTINKD